MRVAVVGCGYVGLVTGVGLASLGHRVTGIEVDDERRSTIASGVPPFSEPGLADLLQVTLSDGRFEVRRDLTAVTEADVVLLAVQTPPDPDGSIDLDPLRTAASAVAAALGDAAPRRRVVAIRSTVLPGTTESLVAPLFASQAADTAVASNPEFLSEGSAVADFLSGGRMVVGCDSDWGRAMLSELYAPLGAEIIAVSPSTAELSKYASNALLATLISFSNEMAGIAETLDGVDVEEVLSVVHRDRRLSPVVEGRTVRPEILGYLKAGCGFGGSCLPKDLSALLAHQSDRGFERPLLAAVEAVNETQADRVVALAEAELGDLRGRYVAVLGVAFKAGTDDIRSSPGIRIVDELLARGASVVVFDPLVSSARLEDQRARGVIVAPTLEAALAASDACIITTLAEEFSQIPDLLHAVDGDAPLVVDGRRLLDPTGADRPIAAVGLSAPTRATEVPTSASAVPRC